jgi:hypothetical protein
MKTKRIAGLIALLGLAVVLVACGKPGTLGIESLEEVAGVRVTAENAGSDQVVTSEAAVVIENNQVLVFSPDLESGKFHVTLTSSDGTVAYDEDVEGRVMFTVGIDPGTYDIEVSGVNGATGWMTVFGMSGDELVAQDEALAEALEQTGLGSDVLTTE